MPRGAMIGQRSNLSLGPLSPSLAWKQKEKVIKAARAIKLSDVMFLEDYSQRTLERRQMQIPKLIDARKRGKF